MKDENDHFMIRQKLRLEVLIKAYKENLYNLEKQRGIIEAQKQKNLALKMVLKNTMKWKKI